MHIDFIKINKSMHNYSIVVVLVWRLTGQFLFYIFLWKNSKHLKQKQGTSGNFYPYNIHKQKHLK